MKQRHTYRSYGYQLFCLALLVLLGCSEVIDLDAPSEPGQVVLHGRITNGTLGNTINISLTTIVGQEPRQLSGARVFVSDSQGHSGEYLEVEPGVYELERGYVGSIGKAYSIEVNLPDGTRIGSRPEVMPTIDAQDSLYFEIRDIEEGSDQGVTFTRTVLSVWGDTQIDNPRPDLFLRWNLEEVYTFGQAFLPSQNFPFYDRLICYITETLEDQAIWLYDGSELRAERIVGQHFTDRTIDDSFRAVHYFNLIQQSITAGAHRFWDAIDQNTNRVGSIFDQPPGEVPTNLVSLDDPDVEVIGYFEVVATDTAHLKITNVDIDRFYPPYCVTPPEVAWVPFMCFPCIERFFEPECLNCLLLGDRSSLNRPHYFD